MCNVLLNKTQHDILETKLKFDIIKRLSDDYNSIQLELCIDLIFIVIVQPYGVDLVL